MQVPDGHERMIILERCCASYARAQYGVACGLLMRDDATSSSITFGILLLRAEQCRRREAVKQLRNVVRFSATLFCDCKRTPRTKILSRVQRLHFCVGVLQAGQLPAVGLDLLLEYSRVRCI